MDRRSTSLLFFVLVLLLAAAACSGFDRKEDVKEVVVEALVHCKLKTGVSAAKIESIYKYNVPQTKSSQCWLACFLTRLGAITDTGKVNMEQVEKLLSPFQNEDLEVYDFLIAKLEQCSVEATKQKDACQRVKDLAECVTRE